MRGDDAGPVDDATDFLDFAAARQGPALRAAVLVTGDDAEGHRVALGSLRDLAGDWGRVREEGPDRRLRRALFRRAVAAVPDRAPVRVDRPVREPAVAVGPAEPDDDVERRREAVRTALAALPPTTRAVAVLRWLEDRTDPETADLLGVDLALVLDDVDRVRGALGPVEQASTAAGPGDDEVRGLLELLADDVVEVDLARPAWDGAVEHRRRVRRRAVVAGGALALGGVAALTLWPDGQDAAPRPRPSPTGTDGRLPTVPVAGATVVLAPDPAGYADLVDYPDAARLALPRRLGPGTTRPLELLSPAGSQASVRAVFLVQVGEDRYQPALFLPRQSPGVLLVAMAALHRTNDTASPVPIALGPRTVDSDRHRLVFPQPGAVVVLEVRSARTQRFEVPDDGLVTAGWASDGHTVVATSRTLGWLVDTRTGKATRSAQTVHAGWADIGVSGGPATVQTFSGRGQLTSLRSMSGPDLDVYGDAVSNIEGWACRGAFLGEIRATGSRMQGLVAVQADDRPAPRILAASTAPGVPLRTFRPLAWGPRDTVVLEATTYDDRTPVVTVLAWDVIESRLYRVAAVDEPVDDPGLEQGFTGAWAL